MRKTLNYVQNLLNKLEKKCQDLVILVAGKALGKPVVVQEDGPHNSPNGVNIAGSALLWFWQDGMKHFVMIRHKKQKKLEGSLRFPSFYGLLQGKDATATMRESLKYQLGHMFFDKLDPFQLSFANVAAAPTFYWNHKNNETGKETQETVQMLTWQQEINPKWLRAIALPDNMVLQTVPDFAMDGKRIATAHKMIHKNLERAMNELEQMERLMDLNVGKHALTGEDILLANADIEDVLEEGLEAAFPTSSKMVH